MKIVIKNWCFVCTSHCRSYIISSLKNNPVKNIMGMLGIAFIRMILISVLLRFIAKWDTIEVKLGDDSAKKAISFKNRKI